MLLTSHFLKESFLTDLSALVAYVLRYAYLNFPISGFTHTHTHTHYCLIIIMIIFVIYVVGRDGRYTWRLAANILN